MSNNAKQEQIQWDWDHLTKEYAWDLIKSFEPPEKSIIEARKKECIFEYYRVTLDFIKELGN